MTKATAIAERREEQVPASNALTPMEMLDRAVSSGASVETLTKLMDLQERYEKNQARRAFDEAMSAAKAEIPVIIKNREVDFTSPKGRTHYKHEDLAGIARVVDPILTKHGLSYRYRTSVDSGAVTVTCVVSHKYGHSEENSLSAGRDESGNKNSIQAVGSTITYLQRYTLKAALGLSAAADDDGKAATEAGPITDDQAEELSQALLDSKVPVEKFFKVFGISAMTELPASRFKEAKEEIELAKAARAKKETQT